MLVISDDIRRLVYATYTAKGRSIVIYGWC